MKRIIIAVMILVLSLSIASALNFDNLDNYADFYNKKIETAPEVLKGMIGNEKVSLTILLNNGSTLRWGMELENAKIVESSYGDLKDATIEVKAAEDAINDVLHAKDPIVAYREAEESGQMSLEGKTFGAGIKIKIALGMGSMINSFISSLR